MATDVNTEACSMTSETGFAGDMNNCDGKVNLPNTREPSQNDHLNKKLLNSFLSRLNSGEISIENSVSESDNSSAQNEANNDDFYDMKPEGCTSSLVNGVNGIVQSESCNRTGPRTLIVGVSGVTNAGKSTLVQHLNDLFAGQSIVINQDRYFLPPDTDLLPIDPEIHHKNWDTMDALQMDKMVADLKELVRKMDCEVRRTHTSRVIFIDGFLIFNHPYTLQLCDLKYKLEVCYDVCKTRRLTRAYDPPDVPGYFEKFVWPMHLKHTAEIAYLTDVRHLDGTVDVNKLAKTVLGDIRKFIDNV